MMTADEQVSLIDHVASRLALSNPGAPIDRSCQLCERPLEPGEVCFACICRACGLAKDHYDHEANRSYPTDPCLACQNVQHWMSAEYAATWVYPPKNGAW